MTDNEWSAPVPEHGHVYLGRLPAGKDGSEVAAFVVTDTVDGEDVLFWSSGYMMNGAGANQWVVPDARIMGTIFFTVPAGSTGMQDNNFARAGIQIPEYFRPGDVALEASPERSSWSFGGRTYVWTRGEWRVTGSHAGVETDLVCRPAAEPLWTFGPFESVSETTYAGYDVAIRASGQITANGRTYEVTSGVGSHERATNGQGRDIMAELSGGQVFVGDCFADDVHVFFARHPGRPTSFGRLDVGDTSYSFPADDGSGLVRVHDVESWHDPRSGLLIPSRWQVTMASPQVTVDLEIGYRGRAYWAYTTRSGIMIMMWLLGRANGQVMQADGHTRSIDDALVASRWGLTMLVAEEQLSGPEFPVLRAGA
jgi:hypothetical protein